MRLDLLKTLSFAVLHFSVGFGVTFALTGSVTIATGVALIEPAVNTFVFFFHERAWQRFSNGRALSEDAAAAQAACLGHALKTPSGAAWSLPRGAYAGPSRQ